MGKTAETVIVLSFAYFSQFPPQFSPCENCALIVQTTLWHFSSLVPPLPLQNKFFYLHYARSSIHSCGNFRCSLIRISLAVSAAVFALRKLPNCSFKQRYGILSALVPPPLTEQVFLPTLCQHLYPQLRKLPLFVHSRTSRGFRRRFRLAKAANRLVKQRYVIISDLVPPPLKDQVFLPTLCQHLYP